MEKLYSKWSGVRVTVLLVLRMLCLKQSPEGRKHGKKKELGYVLKLQPFPHPLREIIT
jgi:hypothetical protein